MPLRDVPFEKLKNAEDTRWPTDCTLRIEVSFKGGEHDGEIITSGLALDERKREDGFKRRMTNLLYLQK